MRKISGYIERITYQSEQNGFTVAKLQEPGKRDLTCVVGPMPGLTAGESVICQGKWKHNASHGNQFEVESFEVTAPATQDAIQKYLGSGLIKGIGPKYAGRIVEVFGVETLDIIDQAPEKLGQIKGLGKSRIGKITACWAEQKSIRELMLFLQQYEVSPKFAQKIFKKYGDKSIAVVSQNPYKLAQDIFGIGFRTADLLAEKMGIPRDSAERIDAGIEHVLSELSSDGHVCYPHIELLPECRLTLEVGEALVNDRLSALQEEKRIVMEDLDGRTLVWLKPMHLAETGIVRELSRLLESICFLRKIDTSRALEWAQEKLNIKLAPNQAEAVKQAITDKVQIVTGGPGTGKSTITNAILRITEKLTDKILLAAPTGRAAKRMAEICHRKASTIHSLLEYDFKVGGFKKNGREPLDCDLIIIDEASMIDTFLMYSLLRAIPNRARVIFVGDIDQLPSVGPGNVLRDLIDSGKVPTNRLTEIFRQARGSRIITNAHRINVGEFPSFKNDPKGDFFFIKAEEKEHLLAEILSLVSHRLPKKYGFNPITDIQVLAPMRRGEIGIENLNVVLQEKLNPSNDPLFIGGRRYHRSDKVMQLRNNYKKEVYNGDVGTIAAIDRVENQVVVDFEGKLVEYDFTEMDEVALAYAVSIHKYQGSECPCVVLPIHTSHFKLLHRNLLYTGVTRGKKLVVMVGMPKAVAMAVKNNEVKKRCTGLLRLKGGLQTSTH